MKSVFISSIVIFLLISISSSCNQVKTESRSDTPNIVVIFTDDQGYGDVGCYGATGYTTPNLDRRASQGIRFTNHYSAQPVCSASRAGLLTGCYPNRIGISGALFPHHEIGLNPEELTIAEMLKPIVDLMESKLFASKFMGIDETTIQVLKEQGRAAHQKSYFIVRANHKVAGEKITIFNYEKSRSSAVIAPYLSNFSGHLVSDGLSVYQSILMYKREIVHGGCWSHARRKFVEAIKGKKRGAKSVASDFIVLIDKLFKIEREIKDKPPDKVKQERTKKSKTIIQEINELLMDKLTAIPKKSLTGKGLHYLANQWDMLVRFLDHPELVIHNNYVEQQIRPFAVGRRAWLFADSTKGANASAIFYSLLVTAKNNGLNPYQYLCDVLSKIRFTTEFESLLPFKN